MDAARMLKANLKLDGKPCGWCQQALQLGDDAAVCTTCNKEHHGRCWEHRAGCATAGCVNAPLRRLDGAGTAPDQPAVGSPFPGAASPPASAFGYAANLPPGQMACPSCRTVVLASVLICPRCRAITSPDGIYHGPKVNAPGALQSLVYGIVGLLFCQIILGPIAISKANAAKRAIALDPTLGGEGLANAGIIMGIIDLVLFALILLVKASGV